MPLARQPKQFGVHARHKLLSQGSELWGKYLFRLMPWFRSSADRAAGFYPACRVFESRRGFHLSVFVPPPGDRESASWRDESSSVVAP